MKRALLFAGFFALMACTGEGQQSTPENGKDKDTVSTNNEPEKYGDESITEDGAIDASELLAQMEGKDSMEVKLAATINECCQKKGCWMDVDLGNGKSMTVRFKDYGFFVPKNSAGRQAIMRGIARVDTQSVDWLRHKAEDAGKPQEEIDAITEEEVSLTFTADAVILKDE